MCVAVDLGSMAMWLCDRDDNVVNKGNGGVDFGS